MIDLRLSALIIKRAPPQRNSWQHRVFVDQANFANFVQPRLPAFAVGPGLGGARRGLRAIGRKGIEPAISQPISFLGSRPRALRGSARFRSQLLVIHLLGQARYASERLDPKALHVDLFVRRIERAAFHPAVPEVSVLDQTISIGVTRGCESISLHDRVPVFLYECQVAARSP